MPSLKISTKQTGQKEKKASPCPGPNTALKTPQNRRLNEKHKKNSGSAISNALGPKVVGWLPRSHWESPHLFTRWAIGSLAGKEDIPRYALGPGVVGWQSRRYKREENCELRYIKALGLVSGRVLARSGPELDDENLGLGRGNYFSK